MSETNYEMGIYTLVDIEMKYKIIYAHEIKFAYLCAYNSRP